MLPLRDDIPSRRFPAVTVALIVGSVAVFLLQLAAGERLTFVLGAIPYELTHPGAGCDLVSPTSVACGDPAGSLSTALTLLSSPLLSAGVLALVVNLLALWVFGDSVEDSMGRRRFLALFLVCGLCTVALQTALSPGSVAPVAAAGGAVAGVLGAYAVLYARARVVTLVPVPVVATVVTVPAPLVLALWFLLQGLLALAGLSQPFGDATASPLLAQAASFVLGAALIRPLADRAHPVPPSRLPALR